MGLPTKPIGHEEIAAGAIDALRLSATVIDWESVKKEMIEKRAIAKKPPALSFSPFLLGHSLKASKAERRELLLKQLEDKFDELAKLEDEPDDAA